MFAGENTLSTEPAPNSIIVNMPTLSPILRTCSLPSATSGTYSIELLEPIWIVASLIIIPCLQWANIAKLFRHYPHTLLNPQCTSKCFFFFLRFFSCGPLLKSLLNLLQYCFSFMFWFFGRKACSLTRDGTCTPCIGRQSLNHWTAREVVPIPFLKKVFSVKSKGKCLFFF